MHKYVYGGITFYYLGNYNRIELQDTFSKFVPLNVRKTYKRIYIFVHTPKFENKKKNMLGANNKFWGKINGKFWSVYEDNFFTYRELPIILFSKVAYKEHFFCVNGTVVQINDKGVLILYKSNKLKLQLLISLFEHLTTMHLIYDEFTILYEANKQIMAKKIDGFIYDFGMDIFKSIPVKSLANGSKYVSESNTKTQTQINEVWLINEIDYIKTPIIKELSINPTEFILNRRWPDFLSKGEKNKAEYKKYIRNFKNIIDNSKIIVKQICFNENIIDIFIKYIKSNLG